MDLSIGKLWMRMGKIEILLFKASVLDWDGQIAERSGPFVLP